MPRFMCHWNEFQHQYNLGQLEWNNTYPTEASVDSNLLFIDDADHPTVFNDVWAVRTTPQHPVKQLSTVDGATVQSSFDALQFELCTTAMDCISDDSCADSPGSLLQDYTVQGEINPKTSSSFPFHIGGTTHDPAEDMESKGCRQPCLDCGSNEPRRRSSGVSSYSNDHTTTASMAAGKGGQTCTFPGCRSRVQFNRACDLRKHYKRHVKRWTCRSCGGADNCGAIFSSRKDRDRHEARHNPSVPCAWEGCERVFSRIDNMVSPALELTSVSYAELTLMKRDHFRRIHRTIES
jgi:hypothetical protein